MSFFIKFVLNFSIFRIDLNLNKYLFNTSNLFLLTWQNKALEFKIKNENKKDLENLFYFNPELDFYSVTSKKDLKYLLFIFDKSSF